MSANQGSISGYVNCGMDRDGHQLVIYLLAVSEIEVKPSVEVATTKPVELVTLTYLQGRVRALNAEHSKGFLVAAGMRKPEISGIIVPDHGVGRLGIN